MIKVVIFGNGNVAIQLTKAFLKSKNVSVIQIFTRKNINDFFKKKNLSVIHDFKHLKKADVYILAISDDAIPEFSKNIPNNKVLTVHTSGAVAMGDLNTQNPKGVFYPLQTISKNKKIKFKKVPFCLEAENKNDLKKLQKLAKQISKKVFIINSEQRKKIHVSAVFVNNFVNHLYAIAEEICVKNNIPFEILKPLINETAKKISKISPKQAQTGPAKRKDEKTIERHVEMLEKEHKKIYRLLTESIQKMDKNKF